MTSDCRNSAMNGVDDGAQTGVPGLVAEGIVDLLEVIQIDEQQRDRQAPRTRACKQAASSRSMKRATIQALR